MSRKSVVVIIICIVGMALLGCLACTISMFILYPNSPLMLVELLCTLVNVLLITPYILELREINRR